MIQQESRLGVADNSGAKSFYCIRILGYSRKRYATIGDLIIGSVKEIGTRSSIKRGTVCKAVIVRCKKAYRRKNGVSIAFDDNAVVLLKENNDLYGTRIFGPVAYELREKDFLRIISLAPEVW
jgi:large subunit ribosomal protein L14